MSKSGDFLQSSLTLQDLAFRYNVIQEDTNSNALNFGCSLLKSAVEMRSMETQVQELNVTLTQTNSENSKIELFTLAAQAVEMERSLQQHITFLVDNGTSIKTASRLANQNQDKALICNNHSSVVRLIQSLVLSMQNLVRPKNSTSVFNETMEKWEKALAALEKEASDSKISLQSFKLTLDLMNTLKTFCEREECID